MDDLRYRVNQLEQQLGALLLPSLRTPLAPESSPFMQHSTVAASDFLHARYHAICKQLCGPPVWHRKQWEWVFIIHHLQRAGVLRPGSRGVGFGVGQESLPALFASYGCEVIATDAPQDVAGWETTGQHSDSREALRAPWICDNAAFDRLVSHRPADMTDIPDDLTGYDFTWSSCCFEHLGSLQAGMDFVVESVRRLNPGGIAVHTTEFNVGSNDDTLSEGGTVIYRQRDLDALVAQLRAEGFDADPVVAAPHAHMLDAHVDAPPYAKPHLKLQLMGHVTTSVGVVVRA
jgi:SAM-dependent methyltransferase